MTWIQILFKAIPFVMEMIQLAEKAFDDVPDSGAEKKAMVMQAVQAAFDTVVGSSTGGQKETWERLRPIIESLIDMACGFIFPHED
jgi:hypothetical protein